MISRTFLDLEKALPTHQCHHLSRLPPVSLCQYAGTLGAPQDHSESCFARSLSFGARWLGSPPGGTREGTLSCRHRGCTCQSFEATIQFLYWLLWHPSACDHFLKENNVKLTLVLCGAALRGSGSQQRSGRGAQQMRCAVGSGGSGRRSRGRSSTYDEQAQQGQNTSR